MAVTELQVGFGSLHEVGSLFKLKRHPQNAVVLPGLWHTGVVEVGLHAGPFPHLHWPVAESHLSAPSRAWQLSVLPLPHGS